MFNIRHDFTEGTQVRVWFGSLLTRKLWRLSKELMTLPGIEMVSIKVSRSTLWSKTISVRVGGSRQASVSEAMGRIVRLALKA